MIETEGSAGVVLDETPLTIDTDIEARPVTRRIPGADVKQKQLDKLRSVTKDIAESGIVPTIIVAQIDPDALGSAWGMQEILRLLGVETVDIVYSGRVAHPQNEALCNKLGLLGKMTHISKVESISFPILVDSNRAKDSRLPFEIDPVIVVDHHRDSDIDDADNKFVWLDETAGSASTMILEILAELVDDSWEFREDVALSLALGVYTDTKDMLSAGPRDREAFGWAARYANNTDLRALIRYKRPDSYYRNLATALQHYKHKHGRLVATVKSIPAKQGDDLSMIADEFLRKNGVTMAIVWGVIEIKNPTTGDTSKGVRVCARSEDITTNLGSFLKERFGKASGAKLLPDGQAEGGALVQLEVGPWLKEDEMIEIIGRRIREWLFDAQDDELGE